MTASLDELVTLRDGRRLGYAIYGDTDGFPVLNCHGGLVCRLDTCAADADARALGVCVISPDRPGVGLSDRLPGHRDASSPGTSSRSRARGT